MLAKLIAWFRSLFSKPVVTPPVTNPPNLASPVLPNASAPAPAPTQTPSSDQANALDRYYRSGNAAGQGGNSNVGTSGQAAAGDPRVFTSTSLDEWNEGQALLENVGENGWTRGIQVTGPCRVWAGGRPNVGFYEIECDGHLLTDDSGATHDIGSMGSSRPVPPGSHTLKIHNLGPATVVAVEKHKG